MKVLDKGFIELVDMMGDDMRVVQAARVSTGGEASKGEKQDRRLIRYLMKNKHWTPFEKIVFEFHVKCPIFVARQWFRHRIGSFNEASGRYKQFEWECFLPDEWRKQDEVNKQNSVKGFGDGENENLTVLNKLFFEDAKERYESNLYFDAANELSRIVMPMAQYTEFFWTVNFRSLANFIELRSGEGAQRETQDYANVLFDMLKGIPEIKWTTNIFSDILKMKEVLRKLIEKKDILEVTKILESHIEQITDNS